MNGSKIAMIRCKGAVSVRGQVTTSIECKKHGVEMYLRPFGIEVIDPLTTMPFKRNGVPFEHIEQFWFDPSEDGAEEEKKPANKK
jgi:hypothetical protein